jgi:hypothetical protein
MVFFAGSCSDKNKLPAGILPPEKMQTVLTDILIVDGLNNERITRDTALKLPVENAAYFLKVFQLHHITRNEFNRSYNYYLKRPDLFKVISDSVSAVISRRNTELTKSVTDSIKSRPNDNNLKKVTGLTRDQQ